MPLISGTFGTVMKSSFPSLFACLGHLDTSIYFPPSHPLSSQVHSGSKDKRVGAGNTSHMGLVAHLYSVSVYRTLALHPLQVCVNSCDFPRKKSAKCMKSHKSVFLHNWTLETRILGVIISPFWNTKWINLHKGLAWWFYTIK